MRHDLPQDWKKFYASQLKPKYSLESRIRQTQKHYKDVTRQAILDFEEIATSNAQIIRDLDYYKEQYAKLKKTSSLANEVSDLLLRHIRMLEDVEEWQPEENHSEIEETLLCMNADQHIGFIVDQYEIPKGGQEYNPDVARERIEDYSQTVLKITGYHRKYANVNDCHLVYLGDGIEGDWRGLNMSKDNIVQQYYKAYAIFASQIKLFAKNFKKVHVHCVYGNHSRMDKGQPEYVNWEYIIWATTMPLLFQNVKNVTFDIPSTPFCNFSIDDWRFCAIHGGGIKMHYKTPYYGIDAANKEYNEIFQEFEAGRFQYMLMGHFHECASLSNNKIKMCGSTVGYHPWGVSTVRKYSPPSQKMCFIHKAHGIVDDRDIYL